MAQAINYYTAELGNRWYIYPDANSNSGGVQYEPGTALTLPADYAERITNSRYPVNSPMSGWINYWYVTNIRPVYKTVTDKCTAPSNVAINTSTKVMTITGGAGGDLNTLTGFGICWRERDIAGTTWGSWSAETVSASRTVGVTVNAGKVRQYRVRTRGSAGSSYYSAWVVCATLLHGNTAAAMPTIIIPGNEAVSATRTPYVVVSCGADSEGDQMDLQRSIDGSDWLKVATLEGAGGVVYDLLPAQENGRHTIRYRLVDINAAESDETSVVIVVGTAEWSRSIESGDVISNRNLSHIADMTEMLYALNVQRLYYGLDAISLPGTVGRFSDWAKQMQALLDGINEWRPSIGKEPYTLPIPAYPSALVVNSLREWIAGFIQGSAPDDSASLDEGRLDYMVLE